MKFHICHFGPWTKLGDHLNRWFKMCDKCGRVKISVSRD